MVPISSPTTMMSHPARPTTTRSMLVIVALVVAALLSTVLTAPAVAEPDPGTVDAGTVDPVVAPAATGLEVPRARTGVERGIEARIFADHVLARRDPGAFGFPELPSLPPLPWSDAAAEVARRWSDVMAAGPLPGSYRHSTSGWRTTQLQLRDPSIVGAGENIYWIWAASPEQAAIEATRGWMRSDGHRQNLMRESYGSLGIGVSIAPDGSVMATAILNVHRDGTAPPPVRLAAAEPRPLNGICAAHPPAGFRDLDDAEVARAVDCLVALDVVRGVDDERFDPDARLSRQQLATIMAGAYELAGGTLPPVSTAPRFSDVPTGSLHGEHIRRLAAAGIVAGRGDGSFAPLEEVQRRHVAAIAVSGHERLTGSPLPYPPLTHVTDSRSMLFNTPVQITADRGWDIGVDGRFRPTEPITRAEMAVLIARWLEDLGQAG